MASGNRSGYGNNWDLGKGEINFDYCDVGLGLKIPLQHHDDDNDDHHHHQQQQQQQQSSVPWLYNHQQNHTQNSRTHSPTISGFSQLSRFGDGRVTFTAGQRRELERQTIIFKYMMASMPVPAELLITLSKYPSSSTIVPPSSSSEMGRKTGYATNRGGGADTEPWRCRRTDGKKWRCSRDVAPDQKYCERHSHKGRPSRSRKPVESSSSSSSSSLLSSSTATSLTTLNTTSLPASTSCNPIIFTPFAIPKSSSSTFDLPSSPHFIPISRYSDWFMKKEVAPTSTVSAALYPQQIGNDPTFTQKCGSSSHLNDDHQSCLLSRPFIDAWSLGDHVDPKDANNTIDNENNSVAGNKYPNPSSPLNSMLPLTLSMSAGIDPDHLSSEDNTKDHSEIRSPSSHHLPLNWMNSWISSPPGGPLAEALCLGISGAGNGLMGSHSDELV